MAPLETHPRVKLSPENREKLTRFMEDLLRDTGVDTHGPVCEASEIVAETLEDIAVGAHLRRRKRENPHENPEESPVQTAKVGNLNSLRHGLTSRRHVLLEHEDGQEYAELRDSYLELFRPASQSERDLVVGIADDRWRLRRIRRLEASLLDHAIEGSDGDVGRVACSESVARILGTYARYASAANLSISRALKQLETLRGERSRSSDEWSQALDDIESRKEEPKMEKYETNVKADERRPMTADELLAGFDPEKYETNGPLKVIYMEEEPEPEKHLTNSFEPTPLEDVIAEFERRNLPFSLGNLILQGYRFRDPKNRFRKHPLDTDPAPEEAADEILGNEGEPPLD